ncbi:class I SAM-dependent methyltransferase [Croceicoccus bisphenolivorans]|uniref:class I SAM-dependent methyltransferase n=1 Tax=Croceicoccus bisphenolivorans TaxID=1783232 RepID=UPI000833D84A|nr:methyltransferase domain-containing protein [Croceicoccus bisphenolivorans]
MVEATDSKPRDTRPAGDTVFAGSIPATYDECLVPTLFAPYARDLVARAVACRPKRVLEIAAGTGVVTRLLADALPDAKIVATDLNADMLAIACENGEGRNVRYRVADAQALTFTNASFDLVVIQFGAMFFPDRVAAYAGMRRVLGKGGTLLFNAWNTLESNPGSHAVQRAICDILPDPGPTFLPRTPFGYHDADLIARELDAAGFAEVAVEQVALRSPPASAAMLARGYCLGTPVSGELARHPKRLRDAALAAAIAEAQRTEPEDGFPMSAHVATARV